MSKQITIGMIAHVDAGKTTLSEALLYQTGIIRRLGRVDNGDAFLDSDQLEKKRGITIFSHQAKLEYDDLSMPSLSMTTCPSRCWIPLATLTLPLRLNRRCGFWTMQFW